MIIKSHIRGGYRASASYLKEVGKNEKTRLVEMSDLDAQNLDEAFHNMWTTACNGKSKKPIHHISINPYKDEYLTDTRMLRIVERAEQKYGYKPGDHQRAIVEHILNGRQHFHVMWCRVSLTTGKAVWPGEHWKKSKQVCREMERELGLKRPVSRRVKRMLAAAEQAGRQCMHFGRYQALNLQTANPSLFTSNQSLLLPSIRQETSGQSAQFNFPAGNSQSGMSEAQRIDFVAAREGRITWRQYFEKWGDGSGVELSPI